MKFTYLANFDKSTVDDMSIVENALKETGSLVDTKLFPFIEAAENGSYEVMAELFEMFTYGDNDILPNYEFAKRYALRLHDNNLRNGDQKVIAEGLQAIATMHDYFNELEESSNWLLECFTYSVKNLNVKDWNPQVIKAFADNIEHYQK